MEWKARAVVPHGRHCGFHVAVLDLSPLVICCCRCILAVVTFCQSRNWKPTWLSWWYSLGRDELPILPATAASFSSSWACMAASFSSAWACTARAVWRHGFLCFSLGTFPESDVLIYMNNWPTTLCVIANPPPQKPKKIRWHDKPPRRLTDRFQLCHKPTKRKWESLFQGVEDMHGDNAPNQLQAAMARWTCNHIRKDI